MTSISPSSSKTINIWNILKKKQKMSMLRRKRPSSCTVEQGANTIMPHLQTHRDKFAYSAYRLISDCWENGCTCVCMHAHVITCTFTHTHPTHPHTLTHTLSHSLSHMHACTRACTGTHIHTHTHIYIYIHTHTIAWHLHKENDGDEIKPVPPLTQVGLHLCA